MLKGGLMLIPGGAKLWMLGDDPATFEDEHGWEDEHDEEPSISACDVDEHLGFPGGKSDQEGGDRSQGGPEQMLVLVQSGIVGAWIERSDAIEELPQIVSQGDRNEDVVARDREDRVEGDKNTQCLHRIIGKVEWVQALNGTCPALGLWLTIIVGFLRKSKDGTIIHDIVETPDECHDPSNHRSQIFLLIHWC